MDARRLAVECARTDGGHTVALTEQDLTLPGCEWLFGYADRRRAVAVVSTFRLGTERRDERIRKVTAHELGHLNGHSHCRTPGCLMYPVHNVEELDARGLELCERCRRPRPRWRMALAAVALLLVLFTGLDATVRAFTRRTLPFNARGAEVIYPHQPALRLADAAAARRASEMLNRLFVQLSPPELSVDGHGDAAEIRAAGAVVARLEGDSAERRARDWVRHFQPLLSGKGTTAEGCPSCHVLRPGEVAESARRRAKLWR